MRRDALAGEIGKAGDDRWIWGNPIFRQPGNLNVARFSAFNWPMENKFPPAKE